MFKSKNNLKKFISLALVTAMLVCSLFTMSVTAVVIDTIEIDGEVYTVEFHSWASPRLNIESRTTDLTKKEIVELEEALLTADYDNYEIITGVDYEIKHVPLKYGYSIDFISTFPNDSFDLTKNNNSAIMGNQYITGTARVSIKDNYGQEVGYVTMSATFWWATDTVTFTSATVASKAPTSDSSWSNLTYGNTGSGTAVCKATLLPRLTFNNGDTYSYTLVVEGHNTGYVFSIPSP